MRKMSTIFLFALIWLVAGCATTGTRGERSLILIDDPTEIEMGKQTDAGIRTEYEVLDDPQLAAYVDGIGRDLIRNSDRQGLEYSFTILDSDIVNAFAAPGGFIYVTRGLMVLADDEAELACVIAHEIGHVTGRHSVRAIQKSVGLQVLTQVLLGDSEAWGQVAGAGAGLFMMKNSREHEFEADRFSVKYSIAAGYDPAGMLRFFEKLMAMHGSGPDGFQGWLSTHPATDQRIVKVNEELGKYDLAGRDLKINRDQYLNITAHLRQE